VEQAVAASLEPRIASIFVSPRGEELARKLPYPLAIELALETGQHLAGVADQIRYSWNQAQALVIFAPVGVFLRVAKDLIGEKGSDPSVVCVDEAGRFAIAALSGHGNASSGEHGITANELASEVASLLGATPVITTASDALGTPALDTIATLAATGDVTQVSASLLAGEELIVKNEANWPLPPFLQVAPQDSSEQFQGLAEQDRLGQEAPQLSKNASRIVVTDSSPDYWHTKHCKATAGKGCASLEQTSAPVAFLHPPSLVVGIGCSSHATTREAIDALEEVFERFGLERRSIWKIATIQSRTSHPAISTLPWPVVGFDSRELAKCKVPNPSQLVLDAVGTSSVAEAAALLASGKGGTLVVPKQARGQVTVAVARRLPRGTLSVVGTGPGAPEHRTVAAMRAIRHAHVLVGYETYLQAIRDLTKPSQEIHPFPIGAEPARVEKAIERAAAGLEVALVCSGDPGIFAMAGLAVEMLGQGTYCDREMTVDLRIVPGVSASLASSAALGAPLGHDHGVVSLSDLLTPWEVIENRLRLLARSDMAIAIYNPRSSKRTWQLEATKEILLEFRSSETPVGIVTEATLPSQEVIVSTLGQMATERVGMRSCVIVGSSTTKALPTGMVTPRGYER